MWKSFESTWSKGCSTYCCLGDGPTYVGVPENNLLPQKLVFILIIFIKRNVYLGSYLGSRSSFHTRPI